MNTEETIRKIDFHKKRRGYLYHTIPNIISIITIQNNGRINNLTNNQNQCLWISLSNYLKLDPKELRLQLEEDKPFDVKKMDWINSRLSMGHTDLKAFHYLIETSKLLVIIYKHNGYTGIYPVEFIDDVLKIDDHLQTGVIININDSKRTVVNIYHFTTLDRRTGIDTGIHFELIKGIHIRKMDSE